MLMYFETFNRIRKIIFNNALFYWTQGIKNAEVLEIFKKKKKKKKNFNA